MMWLTPGDIDNQQFTSRIIRRGYDEAEVDEFLDDVRDTLMDMAAYIHELEDRLEAHARAREGHCRGDGELRDTRADEAGGRRDRVAGDDGRDDRVAAAVAEAPMVAPGPIVPGPYRELAPEALAAWAPNVPLPGSNVSATQQRLAGHDTGSVGDPERASGDGTGQGRSGECHLVSGSDAGMSRDHLGPRETCPNRHLHVMDHLEPAPVFAPERTLADELGEEAERHLRDESAAAAARLDADPRVWETLQDARRAEWCRRVGLDMEPIDWARP